MEQLPEHEQKMLVKKYAKPQFRHLGKADMYTTCELLLIKIHVITGWPIPDNEDLMTVLTDQFMQLLLEDYPEMNADEVEYAFRHYGATGEIKDWGKSMNLTLIQQVLIPYLNKRYDLGQVERRAKEQPQEVPKWECELNWALMYLEQIDKDPCRVIRYKKRR
ncbi:hypothetical protein BUE76_11720 [Cnuella takakiae]|nr:hypothetical protein BUE76_11720 [Cnuella takakiae]